MFTFVRVADGGVHCYATPSEHGTNASCMEIDRNNVLGFLISPLVIC